MTLIFFGYDCDIKYVISDEKARETTPLRGVTRVDYWDDIDNRIVWTKYVILESERLANIKYLKDQKNKDIRSVDDNAIQYYENADNFIIIPDSEKP